MEPSDCVYVAFRLLLLDPWPPFICSIARSTFSAQQCRSSRRVKSRTRNPEAVRLRQKHSHVSSARIAWVRTRSLEQSRNHDLLNVSIQLYQTRQHNQRPLGAGKSPNQCEIREVVRTSWQASIRSSCVLDTRCQNSWQDSLESESF